MQQECHKEDVEAMVYLLLDQWLFVRLGDHSCFLCSHFPHCQVSKICALYVPLHYDVLISNPVLCGHGELCLPSFFAFKSIHKGG